MALVCDIHLETVVTTLMRGHKVVVNVDFDNASGVAHKSLFADVYVAYRIKVIVARQQDMAVHLNGDLRRIYHLEQRLRQRLQLVLFRCDKTLLTGVRVTLHTCLVMRQSALLQRFVQFLDGEE